MTPPMPASFVGRGADRDRLAVAVAQLRAGLSAALVVSGEAGIGKTQLLRRTVQDAADIRTIGASGYESEVQLGFAALHRLLLPLLDTLPGLPDPQRDALAVAFGLRSGPPPNRFLVGLATMALLAQAARGGPLLCVVDDAQWLDQETLDALGFVARRLDADGVGLLFGLRGSGVVPALRGIPVHQLPPLTEPDLRSLLAGAVRTPPPAHVAARLVAESAGNPLALLEYIASLSPGHLAGTEDLPPALPVGERLSAGFAAQIARLPDPTRQLLLVLAAAGGADSDAVAEAGRRIGLGPEAWAPALRASILAAWPRLTFRHPLIRSVVYDTAEAGARRRAHAVLADAAEDRGSVDAAAWHRAQATAGADEAVAGGLERAAGYARERGGYAAEAALLTLAAQRSPGGTGIRVTRLLARPPRPGGAPAVADLLYDGLATRIAAGYEAGAPLMREALRRLGADPDAASQSHLLITWLVMEDLWDDGFESTAWAELTAANRRRGALPAVWVGLAAGAVAEARHGRFEVAQEMFDDVAWLSVAVGAHHQVAWSVLAEFRAWQGREAETRSMAETLIREWTGTRRYGSSTNFALTALTVLELSLGDYAAALAHASRVAADDPPGHGSRILPDLVEAGVRTGDDAAAAGALETLAARATAAGTPWALAMLARSRGVALGTSPDAEPFYRQALDLLDRTPLRTETARTQLLYGEWLRRRKRRRDARDQLAGASTAFAEMGAVLFARRAAGELAAVGVSPVPPAQAQRSTLTPQERRVAELASGGLTNTEISERMFLSDSTVDYHLSKVFRKMEITSRRRLRDVLGA